MSQFYQKLALWLVFGLILVFMWSYFNKTGQPAEEIDYSSFLAKVTAGEIQAVRIQGEKISGEYSAGGRYFKTYTPQDSELIPLLRKQ